MLTVTQFSPLMSVSFCVFLSVIPFPSSEPSLADDLKLSVLFILTLPWLTDQHSWNELPKDINEAQSISTFSLKLKTYLSWP